MHILKPARVIGVSAALLGASTLAVTAQTQSPTQPQSSPPAATKPAPQSPSMRPTEPQAPSEQRDKSAAVNPLIGMSVFSSDGNRLGAVHSVNAEPDGKVKAIHIKTGGFLGFGGKLVAIPEGKFTKSGENIQLGLTADEVSKLPEVKEQS
jgi:hypothetical protein